jgi:hypothetical protein
MNVKAWTAIVVAAIAWILWTDEIYLGYGWHILSGHPDYQNCNKERIWRHTQIKIREKANKIAPGEDYLTTEINGYSYGKYIRYVCLPETVDPRGIYVIPD